MTSITKAADAILHRVVEGNPRVPGVVAMATDRHANMYEGAAGKRALDGDSAMTTDSVFAIFSTTKAITGTAILQCVEEGLLDLDAPAKNHCPGLGEVKVLEGLNPDGSPMLRVPKRDITTRMLMLHTAGFGYEFFNQGLLDAAAATGQPSVVTGKKESLAAPLLFDPGEQWEYGINMDWCGQIVEAVRRKRLDEVFQERILGPLGMDGAGFALTPAMRQRLAKIHQRGDDGGLTPLDFELPPEPEVHMGGHGLYATVGDYMKFIRMWLNDGAGPHQRVLKADTVHEAVRNGLGEKKIKGLPAVLPSFSNYAEFFPGMPKSWAYTFMVNDVAAPTGRPAGSLAWAGLANLYYWIDRRNGIGGFWATQVFPFADPTSVTGYLDFETAVYQDAMARQAA